MTQEILTVLISCAVMLTMLGSVWSMQRTIRRDFDKMHAEIGRVCDRISEEMGRILFELGKIDDRITVKMDGVSANLDRLHDHFGIEMGKLNKSMERVVRTAATWPEAPFIPEPSATEPGVHVTGYACVPARRYQAGTVQRVVLEDASREAANDITDTPE